MDVLKNYTCLRLDVETTIPNDVLDSLSGMHALRGVLDHASDDLAVLKAKAALMMQDFTDTRNENKSAKVLPVAVWCHYCVRSSHVCVSFTLDSAWW